MIVGIVGTLGAGKGTVVDYLVSKKNFKHYSSSDLLAELIKERGEIIDRDALNHMANELRAADPAGVPAKTYKKYETEDGVSDVIFEALHSVAEVAFIKGVGGIVLGVNADPDVRYDRISKRRSVKDNVTREEFKVQQEREEKGTGDPNKSNLFEALNNADFTIMNNGTLKGLHTEINNVLKQLEI